MTPHFATVAVSTAASTTVACTPVSDLRACTYCACAKKEAAFLGQGRFLTLPLLDCAFLFRCGAVSAKCAAWFNREACFYECDRNMGRFRQFRNNGCYDSSGSPNAWAVINIPVAATMCNQMFADCSADLFCNTTHRSYFDYPPVNSGGSCTGGCVPVNRLYSSGADFCAAIFSGGSNATAGYIPAFVSTTGPSNSYYTWPNKGDAPFSTANPNPNDNVNTALGTNTGLNGATSTIWPTTPTMPPLCPWRPPFNTATQCINDMYYFFGMMDAVSLYSSNGTYGVTTAASSGSTAVSTAATLVATVAAAALLL